MQMKYVHAGSPAIITFQKSKQTGKIKIGLGIKKVEEQINSFFFKSCETAYLQIILVTFNP